MNRVTLKYDAPINQPLDMLIKQIAAYFKGEFLGSGVGFGERDLSFEFSNAENAEQFRILTAIVGREPSEPIEVNLPFQPPDRGR